MKTLGRLFKKRTSTNKWKVAKPRGNTSVVDISRPLDVAIEDEYVQQVREMNSLLSTCCT